MNLQISGRHLEVTPAIHDYVAGKIERTIRHFDNVIDVNVTLSVDKLKQKAESGLRPARLRQVFLRRSTGWKLLLYL